MPRPAFLPIHPWYAWLTGVPVLLGFGTGARYYVPRVSAAALRSRWRARHLCCVRAAQEIAAHVDSAGNLRMAERDLHLACANLLNVYYPSLDMTTCLQYGLLTPDGCARIASAALGKDVRHVCR